MREVDSTDVNQRIAQQVRALRAAAGLSLDALAARSGVSRSMISLIERGQSSPTAVVLERLATGLGVTLATLFDGPPSNHDADPSPLARSAAQMPWRDTHSGYLRRNVSPPGSAWPLQLVDVRFPPKARVAYETAAREPAVHQQVWVLEGRIDIAVGDQSHTLHDGDCLALTLDQPVSFHNPTRKTTRYLVAIVTLPAAPSSRSAPRSAPRSKAA
jgi:transcriptional regulator with XRE-family HTH domain